MKLIDHSGWASELSKDLDSLYDICCSAFLARLSVDGIHDWDGEWHVQGYREQKEIEGSNASDLALRNTHRPKNGLQNLISHPKALPNLSIEACLASYAGYLDPSFSPGKQFGALQSQREVVRQLQCRWSKDEESP